MSAYKVTLYINNAPNETTTDEIRRSVRHLFRFAKLRGKPAEISIASVEPAPETRGFEA